MAEHGVSGVEYPQAVYLAAAEVFEAAGRQAEAGEALASAVALLEEQAMRISDETTRQAFLHDVPIHRALLARTD
jgi:hypothetical protein